MALEVRSRDEVRGRLELGVMVSSKDFMNLDREPADFTELLLFDGDFSDPRGAMNSVERGGLIGSRVKFVHAQEFIVQKGTRSLLDLSSDDESIREASVAAVLRARELAETLGGLQVVIHPGGIRHETVSKEAVLENLERSLKELGKSRLLLENMPWFYWHEKRRRMLSNLCVSIEDVGRVSHLVDGLTLDVCHGYLSRKTGDHGYCRRFMEVLGSKLRHIHVSDARAPDSEGLQIGEGEVDFSFLRGVPVPITVEVWNGHIDRGRGFWLGIERLRALEDSWIRP